MGDCNRRACSGGRPKYERPYKRVPRHIRYSTYPIFDDAKSRFRGGCYECPNPCPSPCPDPDPCCRADSGIFYNIRNRFQKFFHGNRKGCCGVKGRVYDSTELACINQTLDGLEEEACCLGGSVSECLDGDCRVSCATLRCTLNSLTDRTESVKCDLLSMYECLDPCRDRCGIEKVLCTLDRVTSLEVTLNDLRLQIECLEHEANNCAIVGGKCCKPNCKKPCCYRPSRQCEIDCRKPCCYRPSRQCEIDCQKPCCSKPAGYKAFFKPVCETNCAKPCCKSKVCRPGNGNVIPVGVMLVRL